MQVPHGVQKRQSQQQLLDIIGEHCLTQVVNIPTRNDKTLDLLFTNAPSPVNRVKGMPPMAKLITTLSVILLPAHPASFAHKFLFQRVPASPRMQ